MRRTLKTGFVRDIKASRGRFISILLLMFISTFTLVGLKSVGPDIRLTANNYFNEYNLADLSIIGSMGIDVDDKKVIEAAISDGSVEFGYMQDVTIGDSAQSLRIFSNSKDISKYELIDGQLPSNQNEIAISTNLLDTYPIGSELIVKGNSDKFSLKNTKFKVVGHVNCLEILSTSDLGLTTVGSGQLTGYGVVSEDSFDSDVYMLARIKYDDLSSKDAFLKDYLVEVNNKKKSLEDELKNLPQTRLQAIKKEAYKQLDAKDQELKSSSQKLDNGKQKLEEGKRQLDSEWQKLDSEQQKLVVASKQLTAKQQELDNARSKIVENQRLIDESQQQLDASSQAITNGQVQITDAITELDIKQEQVTTSRNQIEASKQGYEDKLHQLQIAIDEIDSKLESDISEELQGELEAEKQELAAELETVKSEGELFLTSVYTPTKTKLDSAQTALNTNYELVTKKQLELMTQSNIVTSSQAQIDEKQEQLAAALKQLDQIQGELDASRQQVIEGTDKITEGYGMYNDSLAIYNDNLSNYNRDEPAARSKIRDGYEQLAKSKAEVEDLKQPVYTVYTRSETPTSGGYQVFSSLATSIDKVANIFPIILYAVAALVTFTTMTRYVEDERIHTGTLFSLGYSTSEIKHKYLLYGLLSSAIGSILGIVLGNFVIPKLLYSAFRTQFTTPNLILDFDTKVAFFAIIVSILCALIPVYIITANEFGDSPASLLLPKPPSNGAKIFLEWIGPIWNQLSFAHKVTARNIFRYKKRMFMTILGVGGSVALLFTGLAMQGSIGNVSQLQFENIINYDMIVIGADNSNVGESEQVSKLLEDENIESKIPIHLETLTTEAGGSEERQQITMLVANNFEGYIDFHDRATGSEYQLMDNEVIITERLAQILDIKVDDELEVKSKDNELVKMRVSAITEMYTGHYIYANNQTYQQIFNTKPEENSFLLKLKNNQVEAVSSMAITLMKQKSVKTVMQNYSLIAQVDNMAKSLNSVMVLLIVLSVLLAIVILYNITNINVNERIRELSTTKVLGYYDREVTLFIYRETVILALIGIIIGFFLGKYIHHVMMKVVSPLNMMFDQRVVLNAYLLPTFLIIAVLLVLGIVIHHKLKTVDMLEALKSNE